MKLPVKSNAATFPCRKALIVSVALAACSSTSVATAESVPEDAIRTSRAVDELNLTFTPLSVQRSLKSTRDDVSSAEERTGIEGVTILNSIFEKGMKWLAPRSEWVLQKQPDKEFSRLGLNNRDAVDLSKVEDFHTWIAYVEELYPDSLEKASKAIYSTLGSRFSASDLVKLLTELPHERKRVAKQVLRLQVQSWIDSKKTEGQVFALLELETEGELFLRSPAFPQWVSFFMEYHKNSPKEVDQWLCLFFLFRFEDGWDVLLAGTPVDASDAVRGLKRMQINKWYTENKSPEEVLELLKLDKTEGKHFFESPAFPQWVSFFMKYHKNFPNVAEKWLSTFLSSRFKGGWDVLLEGTFVEASAAVHHLLSMQLKKWHTEEKSPNYVFKFLGLTENKLFGSPLGNIWLDYLYLLEKENDSEVLGILRTKFGDAVVAKMLYDSASADGQAKKLQEAQYKMWKAREANIPLDMAGDNYKLLLKMTASYFEWIKAQKPEVRSSPQRIRF